VTISGGVNYTNSGNVVGDFSVGADGSGVTSINGFGTLPGKNGGTAAVSVSINRFLWWSFGSVQVNDPGAGVNSLGAPLIFAPTPAGTKASTTVSAGWFTFDGGFKSYTITATINDRS